MESSDDLAGLRDGEAEILVLYNQQSTHSA